MLIIDPGFFSVDWVVICNDEIHNQSSGTSFNASSVLLEEVAKLMSRKLDAKVSVESIENTIRNNRPSVMVMGQRVDIAPYLKLAREKIGPAVSESIQQAIRNEHKAIDLVVMVGGGAPLYLDLIRHTFPRLKVLMTQDAVYSNCRGFWMLGAASE